MIASKREGSRQFYQRQCFSKDSVRYHKQWLVILALSTIIYACNGKSIHEQDLQTGQYPLNSTRHQQVTRAGVFGWVDANTVNQMVNYSTISDSEPKYNDRSETHFDNCYWNEGRDFVILNRNNAISNAIQYQNTGKAEYLAAFYLSVGLAMHATQDFYAHSNWVETHDPGVLADFNDPGAPEPDGWYSGTVDHTGDTGPNAGAAHCPPGTPTHAELNKDAPGGAANDEAFFNATLATTDQLNRIIAGIRASIPAATANKVLAAVGFVAPAPAYTQSRVDYTHPVEVPGGGPDGLMTPMLFCRPGTYVGAFEQLVEPQGTGDDTGLNTVMFYCTDQSGVQVEPLIAWAGVWGTWSKLSACSRSNGCSSSNGFINRAELKAQAFQVSIDNTGADAARFWCTNGTALAATNDDLRGEWSGAAGCDAGEAVCGAQIKYQAPQGVGDDTAMNGLNLLCCSLEQLKKK